MPLFEHRIPFYPTMTNKDWHVCHSINNAPFQRSTMLLVAFCNDYITSLCPRPSIATNEPFSPQLMGMYLRRSVRNSSELTEQRVKLVFGNSCHSVSPLFQSPVMNVVGERVCCCKGAWVHNMMHFLESKMCCYIVKLCM